MGVAKVIINDVTEIDLTADTVTADTLAEGKTAHNSKGEIITGTMTSGGGGGTVTGSDILRFVDIDGNVVSTSSPSTITALPSQPSVDGLDSMGWSLTLDECKAKTGTVTVSPVYKPSDNKTHIFVHVSNDSDGLQEVSIMCMTFGDNPLTIDWGDGSTAKDATTSKYSTLDSGTVVYRATQSHTYDSAGLYDITLSCDTRYVLSGYNYFDSYTLLYDSTQRYNVTAIYAYKCATVKGCFKDFYRLKKYTEYDVIHPYDLNGVENNIDTSIGSSAFSSCYALALTSLPSGLTSIGGSAFRYCANLALTSLPEGITSIGSYAFSSCYALALTSLPEGITSIGSYAFQSCYALALTSLPEGITSIGDSAFEFCFSLALTSLPEGITSIGNSAFSSCYALALTSLPSGLTSIGSSAFSSCYALALTSLPEGVTSIGDYAFRYCTGLTSLTFKGTPTTISSSAFPSCTNLKDIYVPWSEGAVANAPWGATNATIHYDSTV